MAGWINQFRTEVYSQVGHLQRIKIPESMNIRNGLIVGSGDSYACALLMEYLSNHELLAYHPSEILRCPQMLLGQEIIFISASGKTRSNIQAAKLARKSKIKSTALTTIPRSALEKVCSGTLTLDYIHTIQSSNTGIVEFTSTAIACMMLIGISINLDKLPKIMSDAHEQVKLYDDILPAKFNAVYFLGDGISYPLAKYGALKMNDLFGFRSSGYPLDDYYHSPIFSLKKPDCVFIIDPEKARDSISANFHRKLRTTHSQTYYFQPKLGRSIFERTLFSIFVVQILGLTLAEKVGLDNPYYLSKKGLLKLSSSLIY